MTIEQIEARLHEPGGGPELVAWIDSQGFDAELICFAARCLAGAAGTVQGATAFLSRLFESGLATGLVAAGG